MFIKPDPELILHVTREGKSQQILHTEPCQYHLDGYYYTIRGCFDPL